MLRPREAGIDFVNKAAVLVGPVDVDLAEIGWVIIGAETGHRAGKIAPRPEWVDGIRARSNGAAIFLKNNLRSFYPESCQQFPGGI